MNNSWLHWIVGFFALLIIGSYGFTYRATNDAKSDLALRLDRIEAKLDMMIQNRGVFINRDLFTDRERR